MPLPPHPRLHLSKVWIPMPSLHRMNDIVEAAGEGIDPLSEAGAYANESTSSSFRANSVRLMHAMYGSISKGLHPKIYGRSSWLVSERVSRLSALSSRNARTRNNRVTKPARYCSTWVRAPSAKRTSTARTGRQPEAKRRPCGYRKTSRRPNAISSPRSLDLHHDCSKSTGSHVSPYSQRQAFLLLHFPNGCALRMSTSCRVHNRSSSHIRR
jgi:hypothetical protein